LARGLYEPRTPSRRFLPPDPKVQEPYRLTPQLALRVGVLGALALGIFGLLFFRLWSLQVLSGDRYLEAAQNNQLRTIRVEAPRGVILDRQGRTIVSNVPGTAVQIWVSDLPRQGRYRMLRELAGVLNVPLARLAREVDAQRDDPLTPITVKTAVHEDQVAYLYEHQSQFPGVRIVQTYLRDYEYRAAAAHLLGHVGEISPEELEVKRKERPAYRAGDKIGKAGVESAFDRYLRGISGSAQARVDSLGRPQGDFEPREDARPGKALRLTLDIELQRAAERALREGIAIAKANEAFNASGGAIVALDPRDGAIRALASWPSYKPSIYVGKVDPQKLRPLQHVPTARARNFPGLNRATAGLYPPGSTFKPVVALAAMQDHMLSSGEYISCTPVKRYGLDEFEFRNWNPYTSRSMILREALAESCDTYFYDVGYRYYTRGSQWWTRLQDWARKFGFGQVPGLGISAEEDGLLPTPAWRKRVGRTAWDRAWNPGELVQFSIGQKDVSVTPLQMARFYALLANGGRLVTPYIASSVEQPGANGTPAVVLQNIPRHAPTPVGLDPAAVQAVRDGLYAATHGSYGTSVGVFGSFPVPISGKTGTAEKVVRLPGYPPDHQEDQAWWCGWGPSEGGFVNDKPPLVVCALIENGGHGATSAAPAARRVFEAWFGVSGGAIQTGGLAE
jgi:penicillin-binding protein 2